ncbi:Negative regulator of mitotic exit [Entomortierella beljakovae]|nr:Negative regulator of mitotic exit [Entomortierella beljakovae]
MAGLFSKKSKKEKEEKAAKAAAAAAAAATQVGTLTTSSVSGTTGPNTSNASFTSTTSNILLNPKQQQQQQQPQQLQQQQQQGQILRDNSSANNSISNSVNNLMPSAATSPTSVSEFAFQQQQQQCLARMDPLANHPLIQQQLQSGLVLNGPWASAIVKPSLAGKPGNPFPRFSHTASYVQTGTDIYIFGGIARGSTQMDMHVVDISNFQCQTLQAVGSDHPPPLSGHTAVTLGQYIMYFGGKDVKNKCSDFLYVLHTVRKEWNRPMIHGLLPAPRHSHASTVIGTTMFVFGGQFNSYYLNDIVSFDMKSLNTPTPKWTRLEPASELPPARAGHCAAAYDGKVYIFGGADDNFFYNDIWCYDPVTNKWEAVPAFGVLPTSRQGHACCVVDDTMYIYGGMNHEDELLGDLSAFKFNGKSTYQQ